MSQTRRIATVTMSDGTSYIGSSTRDYARAIASGLARALRDHAHTPERRVVSCVCRTDTIRYELGAPVTHYGTRHHTRTAEAQSIADAWGYRVPYGVI